MKKLKGLTRTQKAFSLIVVTTMFVWVIALLVLGIKTLINFF